MYRFGGVTVILRNVQPSNHNREPRRAKMPGPEGYLNFVKVVPARGGRESAETEAAHQLVFRR